MFPWTTEELAEATTRKEGEQLDPNDPKLTRVNHILAAIESLSLALISELKENLGYENVDINFTVDADNGKGEKFSFNPAPKPF